MPTTQKKSRFKNIEQEKLKLKLCLIKNDATNLPTKYALEVWGKQLLPKNSRIRIKKKIVLWLMTARRALWKIFG